MASRRVAFASIVGLRPRKGPDGASGKQLARLFLRWVMFLCAMGRLGGLNLHSRLAGGHGSLAVGGGGADEPRRVVYGLLSLGAEASGWRGRFASSGGGGGQST